MKSSLYTIAGIVALGCVRLAKGSRSKIEHDVFDPTGISNRTSQHKELIKANDGFKDGTLEGSELIGDSKHLVRLIKDKSINAIITSPPYHGIAKYTNNQAEIGAPGSEKQKYVKYLVELFVNLKSKLKDDGTLWVNLGNKNTDKEILSVFNASMIANGWSLTQEIVWAKSNNMPKPVSKKPGMPKFPKDLEVIFVYAKVESVKNKTYKLHSLLVPTTSPSGTTYSKNRSRDTKGNFIVKQKSTPSTVNTWKIMGNIWKSGNIGPKNKSLKDQDLFTKIFGESSWRNYKMQHKDATHVAIMNPIIVRNCIWASTKPGDVILDPFSGTGTVSNMAKAMDRIGIGFELGTLHAIMAVIGKDFSYTDLWEQVKIRDQRDPKDQTTEPMPDNHKDYTIHIEAIGNTKELSRGQSPLKTKMIDFDGSVASHNPLWQYIELNPRDAEIIKRASDTIDKIMNLIYSGEE